MLSGGERNRLLLARLFARPANLLVLDEPTNDLDIESLELLESTLQDYNGTLLLVSHDRAFLDNVATQTLVAEGDGKWKEYVGGYSDWLAQRPQSQQPAKEEKRAVPSAPPAREKPKLKLSYKEQRELDALPGEIEALEQEQHTLAAKMSDPGYYTQDAATMQADHTRTEAIETLLLEKLERWEALEQKVKGL
jgi:ATP-binding cassette subfamily F protein uup